LSDSRAPIGADTVEHHPLEVLTIGHSNHSETRFVDLLSVSQVQLVIDTRSHPMSKHVPHFDMPDLRALLERNGVAYRYLGRELGGRPADRSMYDDQGFVLYWRVAGTSAFQSGITMVLELARRRRLALLCSEEDPIGCHRRLLVGRVLFDKGISIGHIRADGEIEPEEHVAARDNDLRQIPLFGSEEREWKSSLSVLQRGQRQRSSVR